MRFYDELWNVPDPSQTMRVRLIDATLGQIADRFGAPSRLLGTLSSHQERCVLDVVLPDGRPAIAKGNRDGGQARIELTALAAAREAGVPIPAVFADISEEVVSVLVLERLDGDWLSPDHPPSAWRAAGAALRRLHDVAVPELGGFAGEDDWATALRRMVTHWTPRCRAAGLATDATDGLRAAVEQLVVSQSTVSPSNGRAARVPTPVTLHGDCMPIHVRLNGDEVVGLLDLGDACHGDPAWDMTTLTLRAPERLPAVLDGYGANEALRAWVDHARPCYQALRLFAEVGWLADHGYDPTDTARTAIAAAAALVS